MSYVVTTVTKQSIHEGGLAVVNMGDYCYITNTTRVDGGGGRNSGEGAWEHATWGERGRKRGKMFGG